MISPGNHKKNPNEEAWEFATALFCAGLMVILSLGLITVGLYVGFGWRGPAGLVAAAGLSWVIIYQIKQRVM